MEAQARDAERLEIQREQQEWLGDDYGADGVTKKDKFIDPYMGKQMRYGHTEIISMDEETLKILRCPKTKESLQLLSMDKLEKLNKQISESKVSSMDGSIVNSLFKECLINKSEDIIYPVIDEIPILIIEKCILVKNIEYF